MSGRVTFKEHAHVPAKSFDTPPPAFARDSTFVCKICQGRIYEGEAIKHGFVTHRGHRMIAAKVVAVHAECAADLAERDFTAAEKKKSSRDVFETLDIALDSDAL